MILWYDKQGKPINLETAMKLSGDEEYRRVAETSLPNGFWVSTVWLGLNHGHFGEGRPLIFETMVFKNGPPELGESLDCNRYSTLEEAEAGHKVACLSWKRGEKGEGE